MRYFLPKALSLPELCSRSHFNEGDRVWIVAPLLTPGDQIRLSHCHGTDDARCVTRIELRYRFFAKLPLHGVSCAPSSLKVKAIEKTNEFRRFGGPIQLASNMLSCTKAIDPMFFNKLMEHFTFAGVRTNGIKDVEGNWSLKAVL